MTGVNCNQQITFFSCVILIEWLLVSLPILIESQIFPGNFEYWYNYAVNYDVWLLNP